MNLFEHVPCDTDWLANVCIFMAIAKSSRLLRNWQNFLNSSNEIPWSQNILTMRMY